MIRRLCGGCAIERSPEPPSVASIYLGALADVAVISIDVAVSELCPRHRAFFDSFRAIHAEVLASAQAEDGARS